MNLERRLFDLYEYPLVGTRITLHGSKNAVTEGCVRGKASVRPHVTDVFAMRRIVEQQVFEFKIPRRMKN